jgi:hypothetical protein
LGISTLACLIIFIALVVKITKRRPKTTNNK